MEMLLERQFDHPRDRSRDCEMCMKIWGQRTPIRQDQFELFSDEIEECEKGC